MNIEAIGRKIRQRRRESGLKQAELAALADVGTRFLSDLENGKATVELGKTLLVLAALGFKIDLLVTKNWLDRE
ncbi:MAG: type II toxin-antitoxin system Y4mF family antitoxin [Pseudomonadota bacterium]